MGLRTSFLLLSVSIILVGPACNGERGPRSVGTEAGRPSWSDPNAAVLAVRAVNSKPSRIVIIRLKPGTDLLEGLKEAMNREKIKNAVILSGTGSLTHYRVHVVSNTTFPTQNVFTEAAGPQDLLNVNGYVIDGRVHAHITFSDQDKALGGHLEPGTKVFTFAIITVGVLRDGASLAGFDDWRW